MGKEILQLSKRKLSNTLKKLDIYGCDFPEKEFCELMRSLPQTIEALVMGSHSHFRNFSDEASKSLPLKLKKLSLLGTIYPLVDSKRPANFFQCIPSFFINSLSRLRDLKSLKICCSSIVPFTSTDTALKFPYVTTYLTFPPSLEFLSLNMVNLSSYLVVAPFHRNLSSLKHQLLSSYFEEQIIIALHSTL